MQECEPEPESDDPEGRIRRRDLNLELIAEYRPEKDKELIRTRISQILDGVSYDTLILLKQGIEVKRSQLTQAMNISPGTNQRNKARLQALADNYDFVNSSGRAPQEQDGMRKASIETFSKRSKAEAAAHIQKVDQDIAAQMQTTMDAKKKTNLSML